MRWLLLLLAGSAPLVRAPWGKQLCGVARMDSSNSFHSHGVAAAVAVAATAGSAAAIAALSAIRQAPASSIQRSAAPSRATGRVDKPGRIPHHIDSASSDADSASDDEESVYASADDGSDSCGDSCGECHGALPGECHGTLPLPAGVSRVNNPGAGDGIQNKLWSKEQFPEGMGLKCTDMANLMAAQAWSCPCRDRVNCIGGGRIPNILHLYEHRKIFQTCHRSGAGLRDAMRDELANHYSSANKSFSRSFVVGELNDCCAASAGLAAGLNFGSWAQARADVRLERPKASGRKKQKLNNESYERGVIDAHVRRLRSSFEGSKGLDAVNQWKTGKRSMKLRWKDFCNERQEAKLPPVGSEWLFRQVWKSHTEIKEFGACGHPACDSCSKKGKVYDKLTGRTDAEAVEQRRLADEYQAQHDYEHRGERRYGDSIWDKAELQPQNVTALNFDAPTEKQFEVPVQKRVARDVAKKLDKMQKWGSKITGVLVAGWGMLAFVTRAGLGSGPNLSLTLLYLSLLKVNESGMQLGKRFSLIMDNTNSDNKCALMVCFIGWLVLTDAFEDASFFCMLKGHTFTVLDQSFNTMISQLLARAVYTLTRLMRLIFEFLQPYGCREVIELHQLWDWGEAFKGHASRIEGFCTSKFGSGMHECYVRKGKNGAPPHTTLYCLY